MGSSEFAAEPATAETTVDAAIVSTNPPAETPVEVSFTEQIKRAIITSGATLTPEDIDKVVAKILEIPEMSSIVTEEPVNKAGMIFQAATEEPAKRLQEAVEKLYKDFNDEVAPATKIYNEALKSAGYPTMDIADSIPGSEPVLSSLVTEA